jgi:hypothetical protein
MQACMPCFNDDCVCFVRYSVRHIYYMLVQSVRRRAVSQSAELVHEGCPVVSERGSERDDTGNASKLVGMLPSALNMLVHRKH